MFRPLFLEHFHMMVRLGLAWSRVQPFLEKIELLAISSWLLAKPIRFGEELKAKS